MSSESLSSHDHQQGAAIAIAFKIYNDLEQPMTKALHAEILADIDTLHRTVKAHISTA